jgi:hypothetical protein
MSKRYTKLEKSFLAWHLHQKPYENVRKDFD